MLGMMFWVKVGWGKFCDLDPKNDPEKLPAGPGPRKIFLPEDPNWAKRPRWVLEKIFFGPDGPIWVIFWVIFRTPLGTPKVIFAGVEVALVR